MKRLGKYFKKLGTPSFAMRDLQYQTIFGSIINSFSPAGLRLPVG
jgi:hypothetical protein